MVDHIIFFIFAIGNVLISCAMEIKKAEIRDWDNIVRMYKDAINKMDGIGINQWDKIYPDSLLLKNDIEKQQLYKITNGEILLGAVVINRETDEQYINGNFEDDNYAVVHRLCIHPEYQNHKIGYQAMMIIEHSLKENGISSIRLDAFSENPFSLKMYEKLGYKNVGIAEWRKGIFYLFEKII